MTPDKHQLLIDLLDKELGHSGHSDEVILSAGGVPTIEASTGEVTIGDDPETSKERAILRVAVEAVRFTALSEEVQSILRNFKAEQTVEASAEVSGSTGSLPVADNVKADSGKTTGGAIVRSLGMSTRKMSISSRRIAVIFVFATCLGGAGKYLFTSPSGVFDSYYSSYALGSTRGGEGLNALEKSYQDKDWSAVVHTFQFTRSKTGKDYFLTGMAYMEQKEYYEAIGLFKSLIASNEQSKEPYFQDEAEYYLALSYLATHQTAPALTLLDKIKSDPHHLFNKQVSDMSGIDLLILRAK